LQFVFEKTTVCLKIIKKQPAFHRCRQGQGAVQFLLDYEELNRAVKQSIAVQSCSIEKCIWEFSPNVDPVFFDE